MNTIPKSWLARSPQTVCAALAVLSSSLIMTTQAQESTGLRQPEPPTLTVNGRGEVFAAPDRATIRVGAVAEDQEASKAQAQVNESVQRALKALRDLKVPEHKIKTAGMALSPIYEQQERTQSARVTRSRIVGYRAHNTLQVELDDLQLIGKVVDAAVAAGANQVESLTFQLKDDLEPRQHALRRAAEEARVKAEALADALRVRITGVREVIEGGVHFVQPRMEMAQGRVAFGMDQATPVQPGEVQVEASITVRYQIREPGRL